jgi:hypothetical protein
MSKSPHFLGSLLTDGGKVVPRLPFIRSNIPDTLLTSSRGRVVSRAVVWLEGLVIP